jgi:2-keto-3-deoxy-L-fuconate dehydrogenase
MSNFELKGKRAIITGGASGIGLAIAKLFSARGASVYILDLSVSQQHEENIKCFACDVTSESAVQEAFANILNETKEVDILVNCAGVAHVGKVEDTSKST